MAMAMGSAHAEAGPSHQLGRLGKVTTCINTFLFLAMHQGAHNACGHNISHSLPCKCLTPSMAECPGSTVLGGSELHFQANPPCLPAGICHCHVNVGICVCVCECVPGCLPAILNVLAEVCSCVCVCVCVSVMVELRTCLHICVCS